MGTTHGTVEILIANDPEEAALQPIKLDVNQIDILAVSVEKVTGEKLLFTEELSNEGKLLQIHLSGIDQGDEMKLKVKVEFVSRISKTLQGIYRVAYKDDVGDTAE